MRREVPFVIGIVIAGTFLAGADYVFKERLRIPEEPGMGTSIEPVPIDVSTGANVDISPTGSSATIAVEPLPQSGSGTRVVKKGSSTRKRESVNVHTVFTTLGLIEEQTTEQSLLGLTTQNATVTTIALLRENDRAFLFSWVESDDVKDIFFALKRSLQDSFSGQVTDLVDETRTSSNGTPVDVLSFLDPAISSERITFLRIRNRLYEVHIAQNGEEMMGQLTEELSK